MLCLVTIATHGREHCEVFKSCWCSTSLMCSDQNALMAAIPEGSLVSASVLKELHLKPLSKSLSQSPFSETIEEEIVLANLLLSSKRVGKEIRMDEFLFGPFGVGVIGVVQLSGEVARLFN